MQSNDDDDCRLVSPLIGAIIIWLFFVRATSAWRRLIMPLAWKQLLSLKHFTQTELQVSLREEKKIKKNKTKGES
jgi:hypothetical protein